MKSRHLVQVAPAFTNYVNAIDEEDLKSALKKSIKGFKKTFGNISSKKADFSYGEGKWTIKEVVQHLIDAERVFVYRALTFARNDSTQLPGFDENAWADNSMAGERDWDDVYTEFIQLRESTILFFGTLNLDQLLASGMANGKELNVVGLGFVCAGHLQHHINITNERYFPAMKINKKSEKKLREPDHDHTAESGHQAGISVINP